MDERPKKTVLCTSVQIYLMNFHHNSYILRILNVVELTHNLTYLHVVHDINSRVKMK